MMRIHYLFRDVTLLLLVTVVGALLLLLPHINPPAEKTDQEITSPGSLIIEIRWPDDSDHDVDLWVRGPDMVPVGYSSLSSPLFNLLRDDLGWVADLLELNYENAFSRGLPEGEYIVNVHLYRSVATSPLPVPVQVQISRKAAPDKSSIPLLTTEVSLSRMGQEITVVRFRLDADGEVVEGSQNSAFEPLRGVGP